MFGRFATMDTALLRNIRMNVIAVTNRFSARLYSSLVLIHVRANARAQIHLTELFMVA